VTPTKDLSPQHFGWAVDVKVATVTLNRPERKNPLTFEAYAELRDAFRALDTEPGVRAVVLTGAGRAFCSGGDVEDIIGALFAMDAAGVFGQARRHADVVALLEPFIERRPNYMVYNYVGFALGYLGRKREAVALLRKSIPLEPDNFWAYYHLGYVYAYAGDAAEAVEMFEKVLVLRPNFPEIQEQLRQLRARVRQPRTYQGGRRF